MPSWRSGLGLVLVAALLGACGADDDAAAVDAGGGEDGGPAPAPHWYPGMTLEERPCPPDSLLAARNFGSGFIVEYCRGCHGSGVPRDMRRGAPVTVDFDDLEDVRRHAARIYARAGDGYTTMPPGGGPSLEARARLGEWLACGAPE